MRTSRFANIRNIKFPLSISQYPPKWYTGPEFKVLAPPWALVNQAHNGMSREEYHQEFIRLVLKALDPREVYDAILDAYTDDAVLLCFEKIENPGDFCHRRMVAQWFEESLNVKVPEWEVPPKVRSTLSF